MNDASGDSDRAHLAINAIFRSRKLLLDRGGEGDDLERRPWFVDVLQCPIRSCFGFGFGNFVRIESRRVGERKDLSVAWIEHDCRA